MMRFVCENCRAQYMIGDEKIGPKGVKVKCRKCGTLILVQKDSTVEAKPLPSHPAVPPSPSDTLLGGVDDDDMGAVFGQALGEPPPRMLDEENKTQILDVETAKKLFQQALQANEVKPAEPENSSGWYVAINAQQEGPMTVQQIKARWDEGEVTANSLCWRLGQTDWLPIFQVPGLAALLPSRMAQSIAPQIAPAPPPEPTLDPVQETPEESSDWKPGAASAFASLIEDEMKAFQTAPPPPPEPTDIETTFRPVIPTPPPPTPSSPKGMLIGGIIGGVVLLGLVVAVIALFVVERKDQDRMKASEVRRVVVIPAAPSVEPSLPLEKATPPLALAPPVAPALPISPRVTNLPERVPPERLRRMSARERAREKQREKERDRERARNAKEDHAPFQPDASDTGGGEVITKSEGPPTSAASDDEFDKAFGGEGKGGGKRPKTPNVYVPPAPGTVDIPETLGQSDITQVVISHKSQILDCVKTQKEKDASVSGRLAMRWIVQTSGKTSDISCQSDEFKSSYMASCLAGLIRGWTFPRHRVQGGPILFPFTF